MRLAIWQNKKENQTAKQKLNNKSLKQKETIQVKIKVMPRLAVKRVYYFDHRNGVLKNKATSKYKMLSSLAATVLVLGGGGIAVTKYMDYSQNKKNTASILQRQGELELDTSKKQGQAGSNLKDATLKAREDEKLAKDIKSKLKNVPGGQKWSVYVRDLKSDRMASINADTLMDAPTLSNLFTVAPLEAKHPTSKWDYSLGKATMMDCVRIIVSAPDSNCTRLIAKYADLKNADSINNGLGFKKTTITSSKQQTTAREIGDLLFRLQHSQVLSDKARRAVFDGLYGQKSRDGVPAGCDEKCLIANIAGENKNLRHDAAIVTSGDAKYVVVIMTSNNANWGQIADVASHVRAAFQP